MQEKTMFKLEGRRIINSDRIVYCVNMNKDEKGEPIYQVVAAADHANLKDVYSYWTKDLRAWAKINLVAEQK